MEKPDAFNQVRQAIEEYTRHHTLPVQIIVPPDLHAAFLADVRSTGHAATVWGVPVVTGAVEVVTCEGGEDIPRWWQVWRKRPDIAATAARRAALEQGHDRNN